MKMRLKELPLQIAISVQAGTNLLVVSKPGIGKSQTIEATAKRIQAKDPDFGYVSFDLSTCSPIDFGATMPNRDSGTLDYYPNGILPNAYLTPEWRGIINISEMLNADNSVGKLMQKYENGESINGKLRKPKGAVIIADSNRLVDKSGVTVQSRAHMSRYEQQEVYTEAEDNVQFAEEHDFHHHVCSFMKDFPHLIDNYEQAFGLVTGNGRETGEQRQQRELALEDAKRGVWACMRGWERISNILKACEALNRPFSPMRAFGSVGQAVGQQFVVHREQLLKLRSIDEILADPKNVEIPSSISEVYATIMMITQKLKISDLKKAAQYIDRLQGDLRVMAIRRLQQRQQREASFNVSNTDVWKAWCRDQSIMDMLTARG